jgi:hypothetical protein
MGDPQAIDVVQLECWTPLSIMVETSRRKTRVSAVVCEPYDFLDGDARLNLFEDLPGWCPHVVDRALILDPFGGGQEVSIYGGSTAAARA